MRALLTYAVARGVSTQAWLVPWVTFLALMGIIAVAGGAGNGDEGPTTPDSGYPLSVGTMLILPMAAWLMVATIRHQSTSDAEILRAASPRRHGPYAAGLTGALLAALAMVPISVVYGALHSGGLSRNELLAGVLAGLTACLSGVTIGAIAATLERPVPRLLLVVLGCSIEIGVGGAPVGFLLNDLEHVGPGASLLPFLIATALAAVIVVPVGLAASVLSERLR